MTMIIIIIIIHKPPLVHLFQTDQYWLSSDEAEPLEIEASSYNITYVTFISQLGSQIKKPKLQWKWRGEKNKLLAKHAIPHQITFSSNFREGDLGKTPKELSASDPILEKKFMTS